MLRFNGGTKSYMAVLSPLADRLHTACQHASAATVPPVDNGKTLSYDGDGMRNYDVMPAFDAAWVKFVIH